jgi:hypothetical protein
MVFDVTPLNDSEKVVGASLIERFHDEVLSRFPTRLIGVVNMDGGFNSPQVRKRARRARLVENLHHASHADTDKARQRVAGLRGERIKIKHKNKNWMTDGLHQLICKCGRGTVTPRIGINAKNGEMFVRAEGVCKFGCGTITITSGLWRKAKNPNHWEKVNTADPVEVERAELGFGNPLTFDDLTSAAYGRQRRSCQEGLNSVVATRMGLTTGKRRYNTIQDARADVAMSYGLMHLLTMIQRRAETRTTAPPLPAEALAA